MMLIDDIRDYILNNYSKEDDLIVRGLWETVCLFKPSPTERMFKYKFLVAQNIGQGAAYTDISQEFDDIDLYIGKHFFDMDFNCCHAITELAIMDAIFSTRAKSKFDKIQLSGNSIEKSGLRAKIIADEVTKLLGDRKGTVVNIGVVLNIMKAVHEQGHTVYGSDFDQELIGKKYFDGKSEVFSAEENGRLIEMADVIVITGMTIATRTFDELLGKAKAHGTKVIVFAETASNLYDFMLERGVDVVVSEPFPFYIFQGETTIKIVRKADQ